MHKSFDKVLASRITEVFQNHQEQYKPDDWEKLRAKISKNKKGVVVWFPYLTKAASVLIFLGLSIFTLNELKNNKDKIAVSSQLDENNADADTSVKTSSASKSVQNQKNRIYNTADKEIVINTMLNYDGEIKSGNIKQEEYIVVKTDSISEIDNDELRFANIKAELVKQQEDIKNGNKINPDSSLINLNNELPDIEFVEKKKNPNGFDFGVEVATVSNYAMEGNGSSFNVGGGFSTAWNFSKKISLSTGMVLARQSINYNQSQSSNNVMSDMNGLYAAANTLKTVDMNTADSKIEFLGIDIPLNIQFRFNRMMLTTGISSLLYFHEKYSYSYIATVTNTSYNFDSQRYESQNTVSQINEQQKTQDFNRFDFARLINVAVGYKLPLYNGGLVFEPYIKLPIGDISSYNIKMGSGGMAFRYLF